MTFAAKPWSRPGLEEHQARAPALPCPAAAYHSWTTSAQAASPAARIGRDGGVNGQSLFRSNVRSNTGTAARAAAFRASRRDARLPTGAGAVARTTGSGARHDPPVRSTVCQLGQGCLRSGCSSCRTRTVFSGRRGRYRAGIHRYALGHGLPAGTALCGGSAEGPGESTRDPAPTSKSASPRRVTPELRWPRLACGPASS